MISITCHQEPTLAETLSDPLIQAVMTADGVRPEDIETMMRAVVWGGGKRRRRVGALIRGETAV